jgi:hypothetical protein
MIGIQTQKLLRIGDKLSHEVCYSTFNKYTQSASYFEQTSNNMDEHFLAVHRDSTIMNVQMHIKPDSMDEIVLWIEFNRSKQPQRRMSSSQSKGAEGIGASINEDRSLHDFQPGDSGLDFTVMQSKRPKPMVAVSSFGSATHKVVQVQVPIDIVNTRPRTRPSQIDGNQFLPRRISFATVVAPHVDGLNIPKYSAETLQTCIDDYVTIDSFGQGAYGVVKLAQHKTKKEQERVVIKYVVKSRILVDCWTRDRVLGMMPLEIHILHTLRQIPHHNICQMGKWFSDDILLVCDALLKTLSLLSRLF